MEISKDTSEVIKFLNEITGDSLRKPGDLAVILEIGASYGFDELINDIIFTGASIWNISRSLKKATHSSEDTKPLEKEILNSAEELKRYLTDIIIYADEETNSRFQEVYLKESGGALKNIIDLSHDLAELKNVQNILKSKS
jgi:hypothetical protein